MDNTKDINVIGIIPARYSSSRLPGKPLADICGKTLLQRVYEAVSASGIIRRVVVATDDKRISDHCSAIGAECVMTSADLLSGTDRVYESYKILNENTDYVVNIQGDEPLINSDLLDTLLLKLAGSKADVGTIIKRISNYEELDDPSVVKVVLNADSEALYFSRLPIPYARDTRAKERLDKIIYWKHIGVYAYTIKALEKFKSLPASVLEQTEKLEQLRLMEQGAKYLCVEAEDELIGVDTPEDLERIRRYFSLEAQI